MERNDSRDYPYLLHIVKCFSMLRFCVCHTLRNSLASSNFINGFDFCITAQYCFKPFCDNMVIISNNTTPNMDTFNNFTYCTLKLPNVVVQNISSYNFVNTWISLDWIPSLLTAFIVTFGSIQFIGYYKYGTPHWLVSALSYVAPGFATDQSDDEDHLRDDDTKVNKELFLHAVVNLQ